MAYADLNTLHNPSTGTAPPASWGDQVRDNFVYFNDMLPQGQGAWGTHPSVAITQSVSVSRSVVYSRYRKIGRSVRAQGYVNITSSGTANQPITFTLPFTAVQASLVVGWMYWFDASPAANWLVPATLQTTGLGAGLVSNTASYLGQTVAGWPNQLASGDSLLWDIEYESTS